jgi:hypothetical protein
MEVGMQYENLEIWQRSKFLAVDVYPSHLRMLVSGQQSNPYSRRIFLLMVVPLKTNVTQEMVYSVVPKGLVLQAYMLRY